jgi:hypothetical protein
LFTTTKLDFSSPISCRSSLKVSDISSGQSATVEPASGSEESNLVCALADGIVIKLEINKIVKSKEILVFWTITEDYQGMQ